MPRFDRPVAGGGHQRGARVGGRSVARPLPRRDGGVMRACRGRHGDDHLRAYQTLARPYSGVFRRRPPKATAERERGKRPLAATSRDGSDGLEPATSGVTGRVRHHDAWRRTPLNSLVCRAFVTPESAQAAWLSRSSNRRLGHEWATKSCLARQRLGRGEAPRVYADRERANRGLSAGALRLARRARSSLLRAMSPR